MTGVLSSEGHFNDKRPNGSQKTAKCNKIFFLATPVTTVILLCLKYVEYNLVFNTPKYIKPIWSDSLNDLLAQSLINYILHMVNK
jgi:hypothetical protein